jgi:hypothetical protein
MTAESRPAKPMSRAQRAALRLLDCPMGPGGYCDLMLETGCTSYKAVDWVLDALARRGFTEPDATRDWPAVTPAGRAALEARCG